MTVDRASVEALKNMLAEIETILSTTTPLPENRCGPNNWIRTIVGLNLGTRRVRRKRIVQSVLVTTISLDEPQRR
jgi:hypothetical protein